MAGYPDKPTLTITEVCALLFVSESTLRNRIKAGTFPRPHQTGRTPYWTSQVIAAYLLLEPLMYPGEMDEEEDDSPPKRKPKKAAEEG